MEPSNQRLHPGDGEKADYSVKNSAIKMPKKSSE
jgi:hypothetical protein